MNNDTITEKNCTKCNNSTVSRCSRCKRPVCSQKCQDTHIQEDRCKSKHSDEICKSMRWEHDKTHQRGMCLRVFQLKFSVDIKKQTKDAKRTKRTNNVSAAILAKILTNKQRRVKVGGNVVQLKCKTCGKLKTSNDFSKKQRKKRKNRVCKACNHQLNKIL